MACPRRGEGRSSPITSVSLFHGMLSNPMSKHGVDVMVVVVVVDDIISHGTFNLQCPR